MVLGRWISAHGLVPDDLIVKLDSLQQSLRSLSHHATASLAVYYLLQK